MNNKMFFFAKMSPGIYIRDKKFHVKSTQSCEENYADVKHFCWNVRDNLRTLFESKVGIKRAQNLSNQEKTALCVLKLNRNKSVVINDTDKNMGTADADKKDVVDECVQQLSDVKTYQKVSEEELKNIIPEIHSLYGNDIIIYTAKRNISKGEQLLVDYGVNYFFNKEGMYSIKHNGNIMGPKNKKIK